MVNKLAPTRGPLRALREKYMYTQEDLAALSGVDRTTIIRLEQDPTRAYNQTIIKLARALDLEPEDLRDQMRSAVA